MAEEVSVASEAGNPVATPTREHDASAIDSRVGNLPVGVPTTETSTDSGRAAVITFHSEILPTAP